MELPDDWTLSNLQSIAPVIDCKHRTPSYVETGVPIISPGDIGWNGLDFQRARRVSKSDADSLMDHCTVEEGDLIVGRNQKVGIAALVDDNTEIVIGQDTVLVKSSNASPKYLQNLFASDIIKRQIYRLLGGSTFGRVNLKDFRKLQIPLPPIKHRTRIAEILGTWDRAIAVTEELIAASEAQKKALMQQLLTGKRRLPGFEGDWKEVRLGDVVSLWKGKQKGRAELTNDGPVPVINGGISASGYNEESNAPAGTITISEGGNSCGYVALQDEAFWCGGHCYALLKPNMDISFLFAQLKYSQRQIMRLRVGSGLPNIQKKDLTQLKLLQPSMEEQKAIGKLFNSCDIGLSQLQAKLQTLKTEKAALMQQLLTGKRRVKLTENAA